MPGKGSLTLVAFCAALLFSAAGLYRLVALRFDSGDVFPPSSSLRSDPMGCKALLQALGRCGVATGRNYRELKKLKGEPGTTLYWLAAGESLFGKAEAEPVQALEKLAAQGERVVIAFGGDGRRQSATPGSCDHSGKAPDRGAAAQNPAAGAVGAWGVEIVPAKAPAAGEKRPAAMLSDAVPELPPSIPLSAARCFRSQGAPWRTVYGYDGHAVVLERTVGTGSMVLLVDPYLLSNEALRNDRYPGFISWLQGSNRSALFDEAHLGVYDTPGMMTLVKRHRLVPFLLALLAVAALYVWKSAVPFAAAAQPATEHPEGEKRDHFSGLVNLLRRNIAPHEVMSTCFEQWSHSFSRELKHLPELAGELQKVLDEEKSSPTASRDPVALYRRMTELLAFFRIK